MYPPGIHVEAPPPRGDLFSADPIAALESLDALADIVHACRKCPLGHTRLNAVPGEGDSQARLVCVGEAPGATEDETGRPFVGRAGKLLEDILRAIGLAREEVFICNVLKCRPPDNRTPEPLEVAACSPYLHRQVELIRPKVILALGRPAATTLLNTNASLGDLRGKVHRYRGIPLVVTYHPAALLRNPNWKAPTWDDVRIARRLLDGEAG
jgi:DNA polymerase